MVRVLVLQLCDVGSNPTVGRFFFFSFFFFFFFCLSRIRDTHLVRVNNSLLLQAMKLDSLPLSESNRTSKSFLLPREIIVP